MATSPMSRWAKRDWSRRPPGGLAWPSPDGATEITMLVPDLLGAKPARPGVCPDRHPSRGRPMATSNASHHSSLSEMLHSHGSWFERKALKPLALRCSRSSSAPWMWAVVGDRQCSEYTGPRWGRRSQEARSAAALMGSGQSNVVGETQCLARRNASFQVLGFCAQWQGIQQQLSSSIAFCWVYRVKFRPVLTPVGNDNFEITFSSIPA